MEENNNQTTLRVLKTTRDRLAKMGEKDDTFDDILNMICSFIEDKMLIEQYEYYLKSRKK